ncbi:TPA: DUF2490 domain-containing protein [Legionella pneumophila]|nr:DUF2490 domain-containing protein [Legionella pneumophila]HAU1320099.1 DUF2490 domain-containing protein [Legionella pneumophila]HBC0464995.1 DUF2490 domain-containing protein [Legionella pneumophila]HBC0468640.1 DUF2490 domain-containing protein [Legionella pneumophila]HBD9376092.1 DUF2490 domain-containing protein [Legionella pneumophila]
MNYQHCFSLKKKFLFAFSILCIVQVFTFAPARASTRDSQVWTIMNAIGPINKQHRKIRYWLEMQERIGENISQLSQQVLRPGLGYELWPTTTIWLGYDRIYTAQPFANPPVNENRVWQQLLWSKEYTRFRLTARSRLEERFIQRAIHTAWRYRQLFKTNIFIPKHPKYAAVITDEAFFHLNDFNIQRNQGFDQNRLFVGLGYRTSTNSTIEIGYLNQMIKRVNSPDYRGDYLSMALLLTE